MTTIGGDMEMWNEEDGFFYDVLCIPNGEHRELRVRSMVGLIPMFAVDTLEPEQLTQFKGFRERMEWYIEHCPDIEQAIASMEEPGHGERRLLSIMNEERLRAVLRWMLDESEFLSPNGIRSVSKYHQEHPYSLAIDGRTYEVNYEPAESTTTLFGGNSNWRGPVWFPVNYLIIESLQKFGWYYGSGFKIEFPYGSGKQITLAEVAAELSRRLSRTFLRDENGARPVHDGGGAIPDRSSLEGPRAVLRILPRRQRPGIGCQPSNRLDGPGCEAAAAVGGVAPAPGGARGLGNPRHDEQEACLYFPRCTGPGQ